MSLLAKTDYYGLASAGFEVESTAENKSVGFQAEARGDNGFLVAVEVGDDVLAPTVNYVVTSNASASGIVLGSVNTVNNKKIALGSVTITTAAGEPVRMSASGSQIEDSGTAHCTATLGSISLSSLFHAQDFGLFTVANGQLVNSTLNAEGNVATALVDGVIKASDLVGAQLRVSGTIVGVNNAGVISTPTVTLNAPSGNVLSGHFTTPLTQENPNGDFPQYTFEAMWGIKADE